MIRIDQMKLPVDYDDRLLEKRVAAVAGVAPGDIRSIEVVKRAVDARDKRDVHFIVNAVADLRDTARPRMGGKVLPVSVTGNDDTSPAEWKGKVRPVIVGLGPCGLFAALRLAQAGAEPIILERGRDVDRRKDDTERMRTQALFDPESNILFGEGGAGAFSDGKLTTGIKHPYCGLVLETLAAAGAPEEILIDAKPHIGTDRLPDVVKNIRQEIVRLGGEVLFEARLTDLITENGALRGVAYVRNGEKHEIPCERLILAAGHSARDVFVMLKQKGVQMVKKPFAIGARIEHSQKMIDRSQYGDFAGKGRLGSADYKLAVHLPDGRGVYTFCMCPGGEVVCSASEEGMMAVNGMSRYRRDGRNANSALLVSVEPEDFPGDDVLSGIEFQREWERKAFEAGNGTWKAPAQTVGDFMQGVASKGPGSVQPSYRPGVEWTDLAKCLPPFVVNDIRTAMPMLDRKLKGFMDRGAVFTGVETRSSSPVRVQRDEACESNIKGLYPAGEGAGYAGGIVSAAVDGMRCADAVLRAESGIY